MTLLPLKYNTRWMTFPPDSTRVHEGSGEDRRCQVLVLPSLSDDIVIGHLWPFSNHLTYKNVLAILTTVIILSVEKGR